jgi:hypothetical protein
MHIEAIAQRVAQRHGWQFVPGEVPVNVDAMALHFLDGNRHCTVFLTGLEIATQSDDDAIAALIEARLPATAPTEQP